MKHRHYELMLRFQELLKDMSHEAELDDSFNDVLWRLNNQTECFDKSIDELYTEVSHFINLN